MKRIQTIVELLLPTSLLIDIGCDHGYLGIYALQQNKVQKIWNVDIHQQPLTVAQKNFLHYNLENHASFYCSDGFSRLPTTNAGPATLVCAGLGTNTMLQIVAQLPNYVTQIVFLTHTLGYKLRQWAQKEKWYIYHEAYVQEGEKVYELIYLTQNSEIASLTYENEGELWFGKTQFYQLEQNLSNFYHYWQLQTHKLTKIPTKHQSLLQKKLLKLIISHLWNQKP